MGVLFFFSSWKPGVGFKLSTLVPTPPFTCHALITRRDSTCSRVGESGSREAGQGSRWVTRCGSPPLPPRFPVSLIATALQSLHRLALVEEPVWRSAPGKHCKGSWDLWFRKEEPRVPNMAAELPHRARDLSPPPGQRKKQALFMAEERPDPVERPVRGPHASRPGQRGLSLRTADGTTLPTA